MSGQPYIVQAPPVPVNTAPHVMVLHQPPAAPCMSRPGPPVAVNVASNSSLLGCFGTSFLCCCSKAVGEQGCKGMCGKLCSCCGKKGEK